ncbi:MAG: tRNA (adenosine(37)-N6)-threonylcarbamoyltransferase complex transferase subunit TsaD [Alphaproteobacteria bacterium]
MSAKNDRYILMIVLGIETSCDETSLALVSGGVDKERKILAMETWSQISEHSDYGGVVPEIAARAHLKKMIPLLSKCFKTANITPHHIDAVAATAGPGLIGGLIVGAVLGKALSFSLNKPFVAVNHLSAHALSVRLSHDDIDFPYLMLLVSGGHCQLLVVRGLNDFILYGETLDDSAGEVFDKIARLLGMPQPGGPAIEQAAKHGKASRFPLPIPMKGVADCNFSFSGLKTAIKNKLHHKKNAKENFSIHDVAAALQTTICESLKEKSTYAMKKFKTDFPNLNLRHFCLVGGVAANQFIRDQFITATRQMGFQLIAPPAPLCTDNGAMIGWAGIELMTAGIHHDLDFKIRPRWHLVDLTTDRKNIKGHIAP